MLAQQDLKSISRRGVRKTVLARDAEGVMKQSVSGLLFARSELRNNYLNYCSSYFPYAILLIFNNYLS